MIKHLRNFRKNNKWFKVTEVYDDFLYRGYIMRLCEESFTEIIAFEDCSVMMNAPPPTGLQGILYEKRDRRLLEETSSFIEHFQDFTAPTELEKKKFKEAFGWEIPWSEEEPLNLKF